MRAEKHPELKYPLYLFFDYDGTVFVHRTLSEEVKEALKKLQQAGHFLILNTGRSRGGLDFSNPQNRGIDWDGKIFGACDMDWKGTRCHPYGLSLKDAFRWAEYAMNRKIWVDLECENRNCRLDFNDGTELSKWREKSDILRKVQGFIENNPLTKITIQEIDASESSEGYEIVRQKNYAELFPDGRNKGIAILDFCKEFRIPFEQCVCFGDSLNDLSMFQICKTGICMANAPKEVKEKATYCAKTENGVVEGIRWLVGEL